jgi:hypothetical protein
MKRKIFKTAIASAVMLANSAVSVGAYENGLFDRQTELLARPAAGAETIDTANDERSLEIIDVQGDFYEIALADIGNAFVLNDYIEVDEAEGAIVGDSVIVREFPNLESQEIARLSYGATVYVTGVIGNFYRISYEGEDRYINSAYVVGDMIYSVRTIDSPENFGLPKVTYGTVTTENGVNLYREPDENSPLVAVIGPGSILDVEEDLGDWARVIFQGENVYISLDNFVVETGVRPEDYVDIIQTTEYGGTLADAVIAYGKQFIGTPYSWGGTNLYRGVDCSGFVYAVMRDNGVYLSRTSRSQVYNGSKVSKSELKKGDLVFFDTSGANNGAISHVGIYIGDGQFIHSSSGNKWGVTIDSLSSNYYTRTYVTAARVL